MKARENPFRSEKVAAFRYQIEPERIAQWRNQLESEKTVRWSIVGPMGTGKTVLMEDIAKDVREYDWVKIHDNDTRSQKLRAARHLFRRSKRPLFLDGTEALPRWCLNWKTLLRPKIIVTLHSPRPSLSILYRTRFDAEIVFAMVERLTHETLSTTDRNRILKLGEEHEGNVRSILREMYHSPSLMGTGSHSH